MDEVESYLKLVDQFHSLNNKLREQSPCQNCDGTGEVKRNTAYPEPCPECWGKGWVALE